jgi:hypothetical protein
MDRAGLRIGRPAAALVLACLAIAALAACGKDSGSDTSSAGDETTSGAGTSLSVEVDPTRAAPGDTIEARVVNDTDEPFTYGAAYELERQSGNSFEQVKLPEQPVIEIGYVAKPGQKGPPVKVRIPKDALPGQYRVVIQRDVPDVGDLSGEFEVNAPY